MRRAARRDSNERDVIDALLAAGYSVQQLSAPGAPDLLVGFEGVNYLLEVKDPVGAKENHAVARLTDDQEIWHGQWNGQVAIVESPEDALRVVREI